jgi:hypothetical protein
MKHLKTYKLFESLSTKLYHGNRKGDFPPKKKRFAGAIFLTSNLEFAKDFAGFDERNSFPDGSVWEVTLKPNLRICDPTKSETIKELDIKSIIQKMIDQKYVDIVNGTKFNEVGKGFKGFDFEANEDFDIQDKSQSVYFYLWRIKNGAWRIVECEPIINAIKSKNYDGFEVTERGSKNVAIFDEKSISNFKKYYDTTI